GRRNTRAKTVGPSYMVSYLLFQNGNSCKDIAIMREMNEQTVVDHIFKAYKDGHPITWDIFFTAVEEKTVLNARQQIEEHRLKPLKESLPATYDYTKIKAVLVKNGIM